MEEANLDTEKEQRNVYNLSPKTLSKERFSKSTLPQRPCQYELITEINKTRDSRDSSYFKSGNGLNIKTHYASEKLIF